MLVVKVIFFSSRRASSLVHVQLLVSLAYKSVQPGVHTVKDGFGDFTLVPVFEFPFPVLALWLFLGKPEVNVKVVGLVLVQRAD